MSRIVIQVQGGVVQGVLADGETPEIYILDYDTEGGPNPSQVVSVPAPNNGAPEDAFLYPVEPERDSARVEEIVAAYHQKIDSRVI